MRKICLGCCEEVTEKNVNENYHGMAIHCGQDWYCGPIVLVDDNVFSKTLKHIQEERLENNYYAEIAANSPVIFEEEEK